MRTHDTTAEFTVTLSPADPVLPGTARFDLAKVWTGGIVGSGRGVMLSAGDPASGSAGYVALETVEGTLDGRRGSFALQQLGTMSGGTPLLRYDIVPGSGTDELAGLSGTVDLEVTEGRHEVRVAYRLP